VFNGGHLLNEALDQVVNQDYDNIEIIISNNNSSDETDVICRGFCERDQRIKYFKQTKTITAAMNFRFVFERSIGEYFLWAAYDDRRTLNYVSILLDKITKTPNASLVFPEVVLFSDHNKWKKFPVLEYPFQCDSNDSIWKRSRKYIHCGPWHLYGLYPRNILSDYYWPDLDYGPDQPLLFYLPTRGDLIKAEGACFYYYKPLIKKTPQYRARVDALSNLKPFPNVRMYWHRARGICHGEKCEGRYRNQLLVFLYLLYARYF
jgi:glycosyltransferase involved in cell wall biosynthesis